MTRQDIRPLRDELKLERIRVLYLALDLEREKKELERDRHRIARKKVDQEAKIRALEQRLADTNPLQYAPREVLFWPKVQA